MTGDTQTITEYMPVIEHIAKDVLNYRKISDEYLDDIKQCGVIGLMKAIKNFNPEKNIQFKTFAEVHIRGAMFDFLRQEDYLSRNERKKCNQREKSEELLRNKLSREPTDEELANHLKVSLAIFQEFYSFPANFISLSTEMDDDALSFADNLIDEQSKHPMDAIYDQELKNFIVDAMEVCLTDQELEIIRANYFNNISLKQLAKYLGVTKGRVSQIRKHALGKIKRYIKNNFPVF